MRGPSAVRVMGFCGLVASMALIGGCVLGAGTVMAAANLYALVRG